MLVVVSGVHGGGTVEEGEGSGGRVLLFGSSLEQQVSGGLVVIWS